MCLLLICSILTVAVGILPTKVDGKFSKQKRKKVARSSVHENTTVNVDPTQPLLVTRYLKSKASTEAIRSAITVPPLMGKVRSYSGFFTVNETHNSNLFFWFFESEKDYIAQPVLLWLQGGPGDSFIHTLFFGNGPYQFKTDSSIWPSNASWTQKLNMLYIDNPVGAGYSFADSSGGYCESIDCTTANLYEALRQFYEVFPELKSNKLYLAGESYAGKFIPPLASLITSKNQNNSLKMNLQGLFIGGGFIDPVNQFYYSDYYYQLGLLDLKGKKEAEILEEKMRKNMRQGNHYTTLALASYFFSKAYRLDLLPHVDVRGTHTYDGTIIDKLIQFIQNDSLRQSLHVGSKPFHSKTWVVWHLKIDFGRSVSQDLLEAVQKYRVLLYSGQFDVLIPPTQIDRVIAALSWSGYPQFSKAKREKWYVEDELAGFIKKSGNLTQVVVREASHYIIRSQHRWLQDLMFRFIKN